MTRLAEKRMMRGNAAFRRIVCLCALFCLLLCGCGSGTGDARSLAAIAAEATDVLIPEFSELAARIGAALPSDEESIRNDVFSAAHKVEAYAAEAVVCTCTDEKLENAVNSYFERLRSAADGLLETAEERFSGVDPIQSDFRLSVFQQRCVSEFPALSDDIALYASLSKNGKKVFDFSTERTSTFPDVMLYASDRISPTLYEAMDAVVLVYAIAPENGATIRVDCEIPGFAEPFSEFYEISPRGSVLRILPERLEFCEAGEKEIHVSVTDAATGKICGSGTFPVQVDKHSGFALRDDNFGRITVDSVKYFIQPEDGFVQDLKKTAEEYEFLLSGSAEVSLRAKLTALQCAVSDAGIRLQKGAESFSSDDLPDTILSPAEVHAQGTGSLLDIALMEAGALSANETVPMLLLMDSGINLAVRDSDGSVCLLDPSILPVTTASAERVVRTITADDYEILQGIAHAVIAFD